MKNLYRRYRPLRLGDVIGQDQVTRPLMSALEKNSISHAYLFTGPRGCGKTSVARILAHEVNGFSYEIEDNYVDIIEIDGASNRGIDNIRDLREKVAIAPTSGKYKVYIIDEVHMLTKEAFNALLKTLEEPPEHAIFIMATTDAHKVPVTITSRAQTYTFKLADHKIMFDFLKSICDKEKINIEDEALKIIVKRSGGSFRDALSLLDQISTLSDKTITKDLVVLAMGLPEEEKITQLLDSYLTQDATKISSVLKELLSSGIKPETLVEEIITTIIENPQPNFLPLLAKLPDVRAPFAEARLLVALCSDLPTTIKTTAIAPAPAPKNDQPQPEVKPSPNTSDFNWDNFLEKVNSLNDAVYSQLKKANFIVSGNTLNIYPEKKIAKNILSRDNNKKILIDASNNMKIVICDPADNPNLKKDELISRISDIMGGEVRNDGGGSPF